MTTLLEAITGTGTDQDAQWPNAPAGWTRDAAHAFAGQEGLALNDDHWRVLRALQEYHARHKDTAVNARELHDALDELFHDKGGLKYLYLLFPGGPVAQGCRIAGLKAPAGATDRGFGSVM